MGCAAAPAGQISRDPDTSLLRALLQAHAPKVVYGSPLVSADAARLNRSDKLLLLAGS